jgi:VanZ family protein
VLNQSTLLFIAIAWTVLIAFLSLVTVGSFGNNIPIPNKDKIVHVVIYFGFVVLWSWYKNKSNYNKKTGIELLFIAIGYGILMELLQYFTATRSPDMYDVLANSSGAFLGLLFANKIFLNKKQL